MSNNYACQVSRYLSCRKEAVKEEEEAEDSGEQDDDKEETDKKGKPPPVSLYPVLSCPIIIFFILHCTHLSFSVQSELGQLTVGQIYSLNKTEQDRFSTE